MALSYPACDCMLIPLRTCLKFLRHVFFCTSKTDMNLSGQMVFRTLRRPADALESFLGKLYWSCFVFQKIFVRENEILQF